MQENEMNGTTENEEQEGVSPHPVSHSRESQSGCCRPHSRCPYSLSDLARLSRRALIAFRVSPIQIHGPKSRPMFVKPSQVRLWNDCCDSFYSRGGSFYDPRARIYACRRSGAFQLARFACKVFTQDSFVFNILRHFITITQILILQVLPHRLGRQ